MPTTFSRSLKRCAIFPACEKLCSSLLRYEASSAGIGLAEGYKLFFYFTDSSVRLGRSTRCQQSLPAEGMYAFAAI